MKEGDVLSKNLIKVVESHGIKRRDFLKYCAAMAAVLGVSQFEFTTKIAEAMQAAAKKPQLSGSRGRAAQDVQYLLPRAILPLEVLFLIPFHSGIMTQ